MKSEKTTGDMERTGKREFLYSVSPVPPLVSSVLPGLAGLVRFFLVLFAFSCGLIGSVQAAELVGEIQVEQPSPGSAIVKWQTDVECGGRVRYGANKEINAGTVSEEGVTQNHAVALSGLVPGQRYFLNVGTARKMLGSATFMVSGSPASQPPVKPATSPAKAQSTPARSPIAGGLVTPPPARKTWGNLSSLADHFARHGGDFQARDAEDYAAQAWMFLQRAKGTGLPAKRDSDGTLRVFDPKTGAFAAYNRDGTTKTYFKPSSPGYFDRQPGQPVDLRTSSRP